MTQAERDRLVALNKAEKKLITQRQAAAEIGVSERQFRRLLRRYRKEKDRAVVHRLRGRPSNRRCGEESEQRAIEILRQKEYQGFGPTLASEYLAKKHGVKASKETVRKWMVAAGLWQAEKAKVGRVHTWRERRERFGELVQWDTSDHDWLEGRGERLYLITMIDDATSRMFARFVRSDSTEANLGVLEQYLERYGRPLEFYTDKAGLFVTTPKAKRDPEAEPLPPTQVHRALMELNIGWIAAHSPQAKGRVERSFETAQDRLVKGLRVAGVKTLEEANAYLDAEYLPEWEAKFTVVPRCADNAHRPLEPSHDLDAILSHVEDRTIVGGHSLRFDDKYWKIDRDQIVAGMLGAKARVEWRRNGEVKVRYEGRYLSVSEYQPQPKVKAGVDRTPVVGARKAHNAGGKSSWMQGFFDRPSRNLGQAIRIANATS